MEYAHPSCAQIICEVHNRKREMDWNELHGTVTLGDTGTPVSHELPNLELFHIKLLRERSGSYEVRVTMVV